MKKTLPLIVVLVATVSLLMGQPSEFDFTTNSAFGGIIATVEVNGSSASGSDWIAAFDEDDNCAGAFQLLENGGQAFCNLLVYGNDATTPDVDEGIDAGETFTFKLWVEATGEILDHPMDIEPVVGWEPDLNGTPVPGWDFADSKVINFMRIEVDEDGDGFAGADDPDDNDPCNPDNNVAVCDTDGDGMPDGSDPYPTCAGTPDDTCELTDDSFNENCTVINTANCPDDTSFDVGNCLCVADPVLGCTDPCAPNYNEQADTDDDSCEPYLTDCNQNCIAGPFGGTWDSIACACTGETEPVNGCTDGNATNYNPAANCDYDSCTYLMCEDPCAPNFGAADTCDDYSTACNQDCTVGPFGGTWDAAACACTNETAPVNGCADDTATNYDPAANCDDNSCTYLMCEDPCAPNFGAEGTCNDYSTDCNQDCTVGPFGGTWDATTCACSGETAPVDGCTDDTATNYNAAANCNDGGCTYLMCEDPCAPNFGAEGTCNDYSTDCNQDCTAGPFGGTWDVTTCACAGETEPVDGCTDETATNYNPAANCDDGSCGGGPMCEDPCAPNFGETGACETYPTGCNQDCAAGPFGGIWDAINCACAGETAPVNGCTDDTATNYNAAANCDDATCEYPVECVPPTPGTFVCDENDTQAQIIELRNKILEEAENARTACDDGDNTAEIKARLSTMVDELVALVPQRTEAEKAAEVVGGWFQVWSDNPFTMVENICFDTNQIYQIISPDGYFYNISQVNAFGSSLGYFIRGVYQIGENALPIEFVDAYFSAGILPTGMDLVSLTDQAENGEIEQAPLPPTPVIGITGALGNIYVDDLLRVITDGTPASGNSDLYIMRRQTTVR